MFENKTCRESIHSDGALENRPRRRRTRFRHIVFLSKQDSFLFYASFDLLWFAMSLDQNTARAKRDKSVLAGSLGGVMGRIFLLAAPFIVMPVMLGHLGPVAFGIWMTAVSLTNAALFLDFGIGNGLLTKLSIAIGREDYESARGYIGAAYFLLGAISLVALAVVLAVMFFLYVSNPIGDYFKDRDSLFILLVTFLAFILGMPISVIQKIFYATQKVIQLQAWQILGAFLSVVCCLCAIRFELAPWVAVAGYALAPVVTMGAATLIFFSAHRNLAPEARDPEKRYARVLSRVGGGFFVLSVLTAIALNMDFAIIFYTIGPESVTEFSAPAKLASLIGLIVTTINIPLWAANAEAIAKGDLVWVKRTVSRMCLLGFLLTIAAGLVLTIASPFLMPLWMGRDFHNQSLVIALFSALYVLMAITAPFNMLLNSSGRLRIQIFVWALFLVLTITLKFKLVPLLGFWIVPAISTVGYLICVTPFVVRAARQTPGWSEIRYGA